MIDDLTCTYIIASYERNDEASVEDEMICTLAKEVLRLRAENNVLSRLRAICGIDECKNFIDTRGPGLGEACEEHFENI